MHKFLIHHKGDHVGVAVADIQEGENVVGVFMEDDTTTELIARSDIPLGHKIAIESLPANSPVLKYGIPIGHTPQGFAAGDYVHVHNLKTSRW